MLRPMIRRRALWLGTVLAVCLGLVPITTALAVLPGAGAKYKGFTSASPVNGFRDPVSFTVGGDLKSLHNFRFGTFGCFGAGGFQPGVNYYAKPGFTVKVSSLKLTKSGAFTGTGHATLSGQFATTAVVKGRFAKSGRKVVASGTITISQRAPQPINGSNTCGPGVLTFSAT
jgi:hypothetical protein